MPDSEYQPSYLWSRILAWTLHPVDRDVVLGDIDENAVHIANRYGPRRARAWYRSQVIRSIIPFSVRSFSWSGIMLLSYLLSAWRSMRRQLGYTFINAGGLALGLTCVLIAFVVVRQELGYDTHLPHADRTYRLVRDTNFGDVLSRPAPTGGTMAALFKDNFSGVASAFNVRRKRAIHEVNVGSEVFLEPALFHAQSGYFEAFGVNVVRGSMSSDEPWTLVASETTAHRWFGDSDPIGRSVLIDGHEYQVSGIMEDPVRTSHLKPDVVASYASLEILEGEALAHPGNALVYAYLVLDEGQSPDKLLAQVPAVLEKSFPPEIAQAITFDLQLVSDIHLYSDREAELESGGSLILLKTLSLVAFFVLLLAVVNFVNLSTARSMRRAREVGVRKSLGAHRTQLIGQFLGEAVVLSFGACTLAFGAAMLLLSPTSDILGMSLSRDLLLDRVVFMGLFGTVLLVGVLAGLYPAFVMSSFRPVTVLKSGTPSSASSGVGLRRVLVVVQFAVSVVLLAGTLTVVQQLRYMQELDPGLDRESIRVASLETTEARQSGTRLVEALRAESTVHAVTSSARLVGGEPVGILYQREGDAFEDGRSIATVFAGPDYVETLGVSVIAGRSHDRNRDRVADRPFVINETAATELGWTPATAIGKPLIWTSVGTGTIIGVVKDFHFESMRSRLAPVVIQLSDAAPRYVLVRGDKSVLQQTVAAILPAGSTDVFDLNAHLTNLYDGEARFALMLSVLALMAVLIACLGLLGLAAYSAEQRTREVGIRKVLGASSSSIMSMLSRETLVLTMVAGGIGLPVTWWMAGLWLQTFPYRIEVSPVLMFSALMGLSVLALTTVAYHVLKVAWLNPVRALRHD